jgi:hypothetical protein
MTRNIITIAHLDRFDKSRHFDSNQPPCYDFSPMFPLTATRAPLGSPDTLVPMKLSHDPPYTRFPRVNIPNGPDRRSKLHLSPDLMIKLSPSQTNIVLLLKAEWDKGKGRVAPVDRGWIDVGRLFEEYLKLIGRKIDRRSVNKYANRTMNYIAAVMKRHHSMLPSIIESSSEGFRINCDLLVLENDGEEWGTANA